MDALSLSEYLSKLRILVHKKYENSDINEKLPLAEVKLLMQIYRAPNHEIHTQGLANINKVTLAAIMHKLKLLEDKGYVIKKSSEADQRIKLYSLTDEAIELAKAFRKRIDLYNERLLKSFRESEAEALENILIKIIDFMEEN